MKRAMKAVVVVSLVFVASVRAGEVKQFDVKDWAKIKVEQGQVISVTGTVAEVFNPKSGARKIVNFQGIGARDFNLMIPKEAVRSVGGALGGDLEDALVGKAIKVTGRVELYNDSPQMVVTKPGQIEIIKEAQPATPEVIEKPPAPPDAAPGNPPQASTVGHEPAKSTGGSEARSKGGLDAISAKKLFDAANYQGALDLIARVLKYRGKESEGVNELEMWWLRAECNLRLAARKDAIIALDFIGSKAEKDGRFQDVASAYVMKLLIQRSPENIFKPNVTGGAESISILDPAKRRTAYGYLLEEWLAKSKKLLQDAQSDNTLDNVLALATELPRLRALEYHATGAHKQADALIDEAVKFAGKRITSWLVETDAAIEESRRFAQTKEEYVRLASNPGGGAVRRQLDVRQRGLDKPRAKALQGFIVECNAIPGAIAQLIAASRKPEPFEGLVTQSDRTRAKAHQLLCERFGAGTDPGIEMIKD